MLFLHIAVCSHIVKAFAQHVSWRWCFFINLYVVPVRPGCISFALTVVSRPTGGVAAALLFSFLNLNPHEKRPIRDQLAELDVIGLICFVAGIVCLLIGFDFSQTTCECEI